MLATAEAPSPAAARRTTGLFASLTLDTLLGTLTSFRAEAAAARLVPPAPPAIKPGSDHWDFACLKVVGYTDADARTEIGAKASTVEKWKIALRQAARDYFGRDVEYTFVAQYCTDAEFRRRVECGMCGMATAQISSADLPSGLTRRASMAAASRADIRVGHNRQAA